MTRNRGEKPMPALIPQPNGHGALYAGGVPGNKGGGRPPKKRPNPAEILASIDRMIEELGTMKKRVRQLARASRDAR
jgi:hypothetical protein